ncbi:carbohydrate ABC transporter permease [Diplocloster modestus]|nr:carbohydrate ABC transporter permease [Diplocloster modestus]
MIINKKNSRTFKNRVVELILWMFVLIYLFPVYLQFSTAFKTTDDFARNNFGLPSKLAISNIAEAASKMKAFQVTVNSLILLIGSLLFILLFASMASYALARRKSGFYRKMFIYFMAGMMVPMQLIMIPLYKIVNLFHIMNTYLAPILIYIAVQMPLAVVIITGFMKSIPKELDDAARIDGAGPFQVYARVILPLIKAPMVTVLILASVGIWNDLLTPLLFLGSKRQTIVMALYNFKGATYTTDWTMVFAGSVIAFIPLFVVFLFSQKYFIEGMIAGAVKG